MNLLRRLLQAYQSGAVDAGGDVGDLVAAAAVLQQIALRIGIRIAKFDTHQEAIELRFR